jgi:hypothetical protein
MKKSKRHPLKINLIPEYESSVMFKQRLNEIQDLIAKNNNSRRERRKGDSENIIEMIELGSTLQSSKHL